MNNKRTIKVDYLARVEGEGALTLQTEGDKITDLQFRIFEPPRFFEAFLRGRKYSEAPDITARICGICPAAYQMSSVHAIEDALGLKIDGPIRELRRLLYCGEWIESHTLHVYMLHAPDFLGYADAIEMSKNHPGVLERGLKLKEIGNQIGKIIGGREIHPINVTIGGFYKAPTREEILTLKEPLEWGIKASLETIDWIKGLHFPDFEQDYEFVALRHDKEYPYNEGRLISNQGLDISILEYEDNFYEEHVERSNALHSRKKGGTSYFTGPLARFNLNFDKLSPLVQEEAKKLKIDKGCSNPFKSILIRSLEILHAYEEALRIVNSYEEPEKPSVSYTIKAGIGYGCTEAPRGILYHRYNISANGLIEEAKIVPPTSQNQLTIEDDLRNLVSQYLHLDDDELQWKCEQAIRNYDPCISCSTHFIKFKRERS